MVSVRSRIALFVFALAVAFGAGASVTIAQDGPQAPSASALAVKVAPAGQEAVVASAVAAPPDGGGPGGAFAYPADGSIVRAAAIASTAAAAPAVAGAEVQGLALFGGEITANAVAVRLAAAPGADGRLAGDFAGTGVTGLVALGQPVPDVPGTSVALGDWGTLTVLTESVGRGSGTPRTAPAAVTGLAVRLLADHGGLPAGSEIVVAFAGAVVPLAPVAGATDTGPATTDPAPAPDPTRERSAPPSSGATATTPAASAGSGLGSELPNGDRPLGSGGASSPVRLPPTDVNPQLTKGGYVFPIYGQVGFSDSFGAPRADVSWHHGDDIFAPLGAPILAVADGTVYSVGWNDVGGNRLWLRDGQGNEFYYAHLSAFAPAAVDGAQVKAGTVLGFVGNTGDAEGTPYHLHFEIHPVALLFLGYDGVVDPTPFLEAWKHKQDLNLAGIVGWTPSVSGASAPKPGAILLQSSDISRASGLDPGSLQQALAEARAQSATPPAGDGTPDPAAAEGLSGGND